MNCDNHTIGIDIEQAQRRNANLDDEAVRQVRKIQASFSAADFDRGFEGILFGKGSMIIFMFKTTFIYFTDKEAEGSKLVKVIKLIINSFSSKI